MAENNDDKIFTPQATNKGDKDLIKKILIIVVAVIILVFVIISNIQGNNKKKAAAKSKAAQAVTAQKTQETIVDKYETEVSTNSTQSTNNSEIWQRDSQLANTMSQAQRASASQAAYQQKQMIDPAALRPATNTSKAPSVYDPYGREDLEKYTPPQPYKFTAPNDMKMRLDPEYQAIVSHFQETRRSAWAMNDGDLQKTIGSSKNLLNPVEAPLKNLYDGANNAAARASIKLPAGTRILAITDQNVNSDHPGYFTATIVRPFVVKGSKLICQGSGAVKDRITVTVNKIVSSDNKEFQIQGQVGQEYPGLTGEITVHWAERLGPALANAAIGGALVAAISAQGNRINTQDAIVQPMVEQGVTGLQNEISRMGGDFPNTVLVKVGTQFEILLTSEVTVQ